MKNRHRHKGIEETYQTTAIQEDRKTKRYGNTDIYSYTQNCLILACNVNIYIYTRT